MSVFRPSAHALITGGASGVGYAVARLCLAHSMRVSIVDSNQSSLDIARKNLSGDVKCIQADVSSRSDWASIRQQVGLDVDLLMLNAGVGGKGTWGDEDYFDKILATNLGGVVNGLNAYVPSFKERAEMEGKEGKGEGKSAIVITGSKQGITNPPGNPAYNASKAAVKTLAEHLSFDLKDTGVGVHLLVPGWTFTGLVSCASSFYQFPTAKTSFSQETSQAQPKRNQKVRGRPTKWLNTCTPRCRTRNSTSSVPMTRSQKRRIRSACCGVLEIS